MRSASSIYFLLHILTRSITLLTYEVNDLISPSYFIGTLFFLVTLFVAFAKPYRKPYMNYADMLLLSLMTLLSYTHSLQAVTMFETERILLASPIAAIILFHVKKIFDSTMTALKFCTSNLRLCFVDNCFKARRASSLTEPGPGSSSDILPETQPLISST